MLPNLRQNTFAVFQGMWLRKVLENWPCDFSRRDRASLQQIWNTDVTTHVPRLLLPLR